VRCALRSRHLASGPEARALWTCASRCDKPRPLTYCTHVPKISKSATNTKLVREKLFVFFFSWFDQRPIELSWPPQLVHRVLFLIYLGLCVVWIARSARVP
jgi:hypothetical protein